MLKRADRRKNLQCDTSKSVEMINYKNRPHAFLIKSWNQFFSRLLEHSVIKIVKISNWEDGKLQHVNHLLDSTLWYDPSLDTAPLIDVQSLRDVIVVVADAFEWDVRTLGLGLYMVCISFSPFIVIF